MGAVFLRGLEVEGHSIEDGLSGQKLDTGGIRIPKSLFVIAPKFRVF